ncbi:MAG: complex I subunit 5 family protein [Campylobacterota bacterium]
MIHLIPLIVVTPLIFSIFAFTFKKYAKVLMLVFTVFWIFLSVNLFLQVLDENKIFYNFAGYVPPLGIEFVAFRLNTLLLVLSSFILFMAVLYAYFYLQKQKELLFFSLIGFLSSGIAITFLSNDIFNIYVGLELLSLSAVSLSALGASKESIHAAIKYLFASLLASGFYLLAVVLIYSNYSTLSIEILSEVIKDDKITLLAYILIAIALIIKTALFPFHYWLAKAHSNAITPVSALLSAIVIKTTFYLLLFFSYQVFIFDYEIKNFIGVLGVIAIFYGGIQAILAKKLKLLIAYSTISQVGYLFVVFILLSNQALYATIFILISHMFAKAGLFLIAGVFILCAQSKKIESLKGISSVLPLGVFTLSFSAITLIGLPPTLGFSAKWYYLQEALNQKEWILFVLILLATFITAFYFSRLIILTLMKKDDSKNFIKPSNHNLFILQAIAFILSLTSVIMGFFSSNITNMISW